MHADSDNLSAGERHHLRYWTAFREYMARQGNFSVRLELPKPKYYVFGPELIALSHARPESLLLAFDQSYSRGDQGQQIQERDSR